jgi:hypothetical protein
LPVSGVTFIRYAESQIYENQIMKKSLGARKPKDIIRIAKNC